METRTRQGCKFHLKVYFEILISCWFNLILGYILLAANMISLTNGGHFKHIGGDPASERDPSCIWTIVHIAEPILYLGLCHIWFIFLTPIFHL